MGVVNNEAEYGIYQASAINLLDSMITKIQTGDIAVWTKDELFYLRDWFSQMTYPEFIANTGVN